MPDLPSRILSLLTVGRQRRKAVADAEQAKRHAEQAADEAHWQALETVVKADLAAHGLSDYFVTLADKPDKFHRASDHYSGTRGHWFTLHVDGVGIIGREYAFFATRDEDVPDYWRPFRGRPEGANWAAVTHQTFGPWDEGDETVGQAEAKEWVWFTDLADALAEAEAQYAALNKLLGEVEARNLQRKRVLERSKVAPQRQTASARLLDALDDYISERIPREEE